MRSFRSLPALGTALSVSLIAGANAQGHFEQPNDKPAAVTHPVEAPIAVKSRVVIQRGPITSYQINVNNQGNNRPNDAANEPSIAINPNDPNNMVAGWRQFDSISSDFRENGWAYTTDGGVTWTNPGAITEGTFYSDPVIDTDDAGNFYYLSYPGGTTMTVFRSGDGGQSWNNGSVIVGGDKAWMTIDKTGGIGNGNIYMVWQVVHGPNTFSRSTNGGLSFEPAVSVPGVPTFGTNSIDANGNVFCAGLNQQFFNSFILAKSTNAQNNSQTPSFNTVNVNIGGSMQLGTGPNPGGLLGQAQAIADPTNPNRVYYMCSVNPPGGDPMDLHIVRSTDGGNTFGSPVRINDDTGNDWQWFGTMGVAPNGRIDAVWNDTRASGSTTTSETYYAYSMDQGQNWSKNVPIGPQWNSVVGWPVQNKIGDYYDMKSDDAAANLIYSATYNNEQDVYFARLGDCNGNQTHDGVDLMNGTSFDANNNTFPDECETCAPDFGNGAPGLTLSICGDDLTTSGSAATIDLVGAPAGTQVVMFFGAGLAASPFPFGGGAFALDPGAPPIVALPGFVTNANGRLGLAVNGGNSGVVTLYSQAIALFGGSGFTISNVVQLNAGA